MLTRFAAVCLLSILPISALAAPVASPVIDVDAIGAFTSSDGQGKFQSFGASVASQGFVVTGDLSADLSLNFDVADPYSDADGSFTMWNDGAIALRGVLSVITARTDILSLIFTDVTGDLASVFGTTLTAELSFLDIWDNDPLSVLNNGSSYEFIYTVEGSPQPAPVPLPAGGLLLFSGLGLLALRGRLKPIA